jgi:hypothetical protein
MANEHIEKKLRDCVIELLGKGWSMEEVMVALQAIKVEIAIAMQYQQAIKK